MTLFFSGRGILLSCAVHFFLFWFASAFCTNIWSTQLWIRVNEINLDPQYFWCVDREHVTQCNLYQSRGRGKSTTTPPVLPQALSQLIQYTNHHFGAAVSTQGGHLSNEEEKKKTLPTELFSYLKIYFFFYFTGLYIWILCMSGKQVRFLTPLLVTHMKM